MKNIFITFLLCCLSVTAFGQVAGGHISRPTTKKQAITTTPARKKQKANEQKNQQKSSSDVIIKRLVNNMVYVEGGTFIMGATSEQGSDAWDDEKPAHQVTLSSFSIGKYEVTQEEWQAMMGSNPSYFKGALRPVEKVSWNDCQEFIRKLNSMTSKRFRLPTEAEWEYASRGGNRSRGYKYAGGNVLDNVAWYENNSGNTHDVGQKSPNELGLYDMSGNVMEWCADWYGSYSSNSQTNPTGASGGFNHRVLRGGFWSFGAKFCRVSSRSGDSPGFAGFNLGLRLALSE